MVAPSHPLFETPRTLAIGSAHDKRLAAPGSQVMRLAHYWRWGPLLDDKVLDVQVSDDQQRVQFVIGPQQDQPGEPG